MRFRRVDGHQHIDMTSDMLLSRDERAFRTVGKSIGPRHIDAPLYAENIGALGFLGRVWVSMRVLRFIWGSKSCQK